MSPLRIMGPACMAVCISSPVRSRKPVLMKATRAGAAAIQALRFTEVRRSSSMMPSLTVFCGRPSSCSTRPNSSLAKATSAGPCILGLTMYTLPVRLLRIPLAPWPFRSWMAIGRGDHGIQDAFGDFFALSAPQDGGVGHQVADVAHKHQRAAMEFEGLAVGAGVFAVARSGHG